MWFDRAFEGRHPKKHHDEERGPSVRRAMGRRGRGRAGGGVLAAGCAALKTRLEALYNYPQDGAPSRKGEHYFFSKNDGLQNQNVLYVQKGLEGEPEVLIEPNTWSEDGTTRLAAFAPSKDGRYAVVGIDCAGSDWQEYGVMEVAARTMLPDKLDWIKVLNHA